MNTFKMYSSVSNFDRYGHKEKILPSNKYRFGKGDNQFLCCSIMIKFCNGQISFVGTGFYVPVQDNLSLISLPKVALKID